MNTIADCDGAPASLEVPHSIEGVVLTEKISSTKPRRRRKKKKKKKKPASEKPASDSSDDESVDFGIPIQKELHNANKSGGQRNNTPSSHISTPQEVLRRRLIENDGYEASQVEQAMEEMWDKGLSFDEYDSVIRYLRCCEKNLSCASTASNSVLTVSTNEYEVDMADHSSHFLNESLEEPEEKGEETSLSIAAANGQIPTAQNEGLENNDFQKEEEEEEIGEEPEEEEAEKEASTPTKAPATMAMKLDTVASFENLTDAIFALTEWVKKAASKDEVEIFCRAEETSALPTVLRRGISSEIEEPSRFESAVQPALVRLLLAVMNRCGIDELEAISQGELVEKIEQMLKQARKVSLLAPDIDDENMIGGRVSRFIASRLRIAMDEKNQFEKNQKELSNALEEDDEAMAALLSQRDNLKTNALRAYETVQKSMQSNDDEKDGDCMPSSSTSFEMDDITLHIVDQETKNRFEEERSRLEELKSQVREVGESSHTVKDLRTSVLAVEEERKGYQEEIAKLRAALEELEAKEKCASLQIEGLSTQIVEEEQKHDARAKQLEEDIARTKESVRYANLVSGLGGMMKSYGRSMEKVTASKTSKSSRDVDSDQSSIGTKADASKPTTEVSASDAMEDYLSNVRNYFLKEADCFTQLKHRLTTKTAEVTALQSELAQYDSVKGLFSTSIIPTQIKQAIEKDKRLIGAYTQKLSAQEDAGSAMYEELLSRLENYKTNTTEDSDTEDIFPSELLSGAPAAIRALKIDCEKLVPFVKEVDERESSIKSVNTVTESVASENPPPPSPRSTTSVPSSPYTAPKLNWASAKKKQACSKEPKKSILDIQKEELNKAKDSN